MAARKQRGNGKPLGHPGRKIGLALAGGGPLGGIYEIGALIALNEAIEGVNFSEADVYVGVSAGALVASLLANGIAPEQMARVFIHPKPEDPRVSPVVFTQPAYGEYVRRTLSVPKLLAQGAFNYLRNPIANELLGSFGCLSQAIPTALFDNRPIERFLAELFRNRGCTNDFRELERELYIVAVDLDTGDSVKFGAEGFDDVPISTAVQASTALPGLYPPVKIDGRDFVDGGLKRTLHASVALERDVDLLFCVNPIVPFDADSAPRGAYKRHDKLAQGGLPVVLSQTFRSLIHSRMRVGMSKYDTQFQHAKVILFEPDRHDSQMFFTNVFSYTNRANVCQHAYQTTRRDLRMRREELEPVFEKHGIRLRHGVLEDADRHFTAALEARGDVGLDDFGAYQNHPTNALAAALERIEALVGRPA
jgi:predicted acylesterase/phospholipase RssA